MTTMLHVGSEIIPCNRSVLLNRLLGCEITFSIVYQGKGQWFVANANIMVNICGQPMIYCNLLSSRPSSRAY